jgi:hypothetical protein
VADEGRVTTNASRLFSGATIATICSRHRMAVLHLEGEDVIAEPRPQARLHVLRR